MTQYRISVKINIVSILVRLVSGIISDISANQKNPPSGGFLAGRCLFPITP